MAQNRVNMSLDEIIQQSRKQGGNRGSRGGFRGSRGGARGGRGAPRGGRGAVRGGVSGRGVSRGSRGAPRGRGSPGRGRQSRRDTVQQGSIQQRLQLNGRRRSASVSRYQPPNQQQSQMQQQRLPRSRSRQRSRSRNPSQPRDQPIAARSRSRSRSRSRARNAPQSRVAPLQTRGRRNSFNSNRVGLRSDLIAKAQKHQYVQEKINRARNNQQRFGDEIQTQTFTRRGRSKSPGVATRLTVSVANDLAKQRRNSTNTNNPVGYLDKKSLAKLSAILGGAIIKPRGSGSVRSGNSRRSQRGRGGRGRGRGGYAVAKPVLNARLQKEIAALQGRTLGEVKSAGSVGSQSGINFTPTPHLTTTSLSERFSNM